MIDDGLLVEEAMDKPESVKKAVQLLYLSLGLTILLYAIMLLRFPETLFKEVFREEFTENSIVSVILFLVIFTGLFWFFVYMIGKGRNWARMILLVLTIISLPLYIYDVLFYYSPLYTFFSAIISAIYVIGIVLLFRAPSSAWFKKIASDKK